MQMLTFMPGAASSVMCVTVEIQGDTIVEDTETFTVVFSSSQERVNFTYDTTTVHIMDNDGNLVLHNVNSIAHNHDS